MSPFNKLEDEFPEDSSQHMWAIFFMCDPDEEINKFYRFSLAKRRENINNYYPNIQWKNPVFKECMEEYPYLCLNTIQRALKDELDSLRDRAKLIKNTPMTLDYTDENGKKIIGTAKQLDDMRIKTSKIYDQLEEAMNKFNKQKEDELRVRGGRRETSAEKGLI